MQILDSAIPPPSPSSPSSRASPLASSSPLPVVNPGWTDLAKARWRVWAPIALRAVALGVALLGLAGIGAVVSRAPELAAPAVSRAGLELGALSSQALAALGGAGGATAPAAALTSQVSQVSQGAPLVPSRPESAPCPRAPDRAGSSGPPDLPVPPDSPGLPGSPASPAPLASAGGPRPTRRGAEGLDRDQPVVLNRADAAELRRLRGVGAKRAEAILLLRQRLGRFQKATDLLRVKGIGPRTLERMLPQLVLD